MSSLQGKTALVTGASRGIGAAIAKRLAKEGAAVALVYGASKDAAEKVAGDIRAAGGRAEIFQADAADKKAVGDLAAAVLKTFGKIDILVNNAGVFLEGGIAAASAENYEKTMAVNVDAVFYLTHAVVPHMKAGARIINISSILGERAIMPGIDTYVASKFAVSGFTRAWSKDLGAKGILVNAVLPGPIDTDMNPADDNPGADAQKAGTSLGRYGKPEEIAGAVAFFAGPDAGFITGALLPVDGGTNA